MKILFDYIITYGYEALFVAIAINIVTAIIKAPVKAISSKLKDSAKVTKYITFMPVILGLFLSITYKKICGHALLDSEVISLWLSSSSLSMALYAVLEKFFPSKKKIIAEYEIKQNKLLIDKLEELNGNNLLTVNAAVSAASDIVSGAVDVNEHKDKQQSAKSMSGNKKLILRGNSSAETYEKQQ